MDQIPKFEKANNLSIIVLGYSEDDNEIYPLYASSEMASTLITLLILTSECGNHYCLVRGEEGLSRLLGHRSMHGHRSFVCHFCLRPFTSEVRRENHLPYCSRNGPQRVEMVKEEDKILRFRNVANSLIFLLLYIVILKVFLQI